MSRDAARKSPPPGTEPTPSGADRAELPPHLTPLDGGSWAVWRWAALRGAGFAAGEVLRLGAAECARAADRLIAAEDRAKSTRSTALSVLRHEQEVSSDTKQRDALEKAIRRLQKHKLPEPQTLPQASRTEVEEHRDATTHLGLESDCYRQAFKEAAEHWSRVILELAGHDRFREAMLWQNRQAVHTGLDALVRQSHSNSSRCSKQRQREELVANYLQRYCVKNDTIGFFGPVGWARLSKEGETLVTQQGSSLLAARNVYFEQWCIDALAEDFAKNVQMRLWSAPQLVPTVYLEANTLYTPSKLPIQLTEKQAALLRLCDGRRTANQIADLLAADPTSGLPSRPAVFSLLDRLVSLNILRWSLLVPFVPHPERALRQLLTRVEDAPLREAALARLDELEEACAQVAAAAGDPAALDAALGALDETFGRLTAAPPRRAAGQMYAARTLVYEDCRRDTEVRLGPRLLAALGQPLGLLLHSARWFTAAAAKRYRELFAEVYAALGGGREGQGVGMVGFWRRAQPRLFDTQHDPLAGVVAEFQRRWGEVLGLCEGGEAGRRLSYRSAELEGRVRAAFPASAAGWSGARHHSPDVMVAAESEEAVGRGEFELVLGEIHVSCNTLNYSFFVEQHPAPEDLCEAMSLDFPEPRLVPIPPRNWPEQTVRFLPALTTTRDPLLMASPDSCGVPGQNTLPIAALVVEDTGEGLVVRSRDGSLRMDIVEAFAGITAGRVMNSFKLVNLPGRTPRINFDRVVVAREAWTFPAAELGFAHEKREEERFVAARRFALAHDLPRFLFAKVPVERKPLYVDFESPTYINLLAKVLRRNSEEKSAEQTITFSEMLPEFNQLWLKDKAGLTYTSELRLVALDLSGRESHAR